MNRGSLQTIIEAGARPAAEDEAHVLNHLGLIIDGNRRWARKHGMQSWEGHRYGAKRLAKILERCADLKIPQVSVYLLSTENLKRPKIELEAVFRLIRKYLERADFFEKYKIRVNIFGDRRNLPPELVSAIDTIMTVTAKNQRMVLNLLVGYGSHFELVEAIKKIAQNAIKTGTIEVTPDDVESNLLITTPVDLIIRSGGCNRLSNFMLWQSSYAEIRVTKTLWPDFSEDELTKSIEWFNSVKRNFGR